MPGELSASLFVTPIVSSNLVARNLSIRADGDTWMISLAEYSYVRLKGPRSEARQVDKTAIVILLALIAYMLAGSDLRR